MTRMIADDTGEYGAPTVLIFADSDERRARIGEAVWSLGGRVAVAMPIDGAAERLARQLAAGGVVVEVGDDPGPSLDALLDQIEVGARSHRHASVVTVPPSLIDAAAARAGHADVLLLSDPTPGERVTAIATTLAERRLRRLHDVSRDAVLPKLQQLSEEVGRIARAGSDGGGRNRAHSGSFTVSR